MITNTTKGSLKVKSPTALELLGLILTDATTEYPLAVDKPCVRVDIHSRITNTGNIWIGPTGVAVNTGGMMLYPGDSCSIDISNANILYAISDVAGQKLNINRYYG